MKPYYKENGITIYHGDCREIIPQIHPVDLVITDPPYGINYKSNWSIERFQKKHIAGDDSFPLWFFDIIKANRAIFVWCRWDVLLKMPKPKSFICWDKGKHSMGDLSHEYGRQWEGCAFYPMKGHEFNYRPTDIIRCKAINGSSLIHPAEKPVGVIANLIHSNKCESILDPFMGSGTTLRAAKDLNKKAIGIEIEERYCEIAAKRLAQEVLFRDVI